MLCILMGMSESPCGSRSEKVSLHANYALLHANHKLLHANQALLHANYALLHANQALKIDKK